MQQTSNINFDGLRVLAMFLILGVVILNYLLVNYRDALGYQLMGDKNSSVIMFFAILVFLWFSKKSLDNRFIRVLSRLATYTLAVYLIHQGMINNKEFWIFGIQEKLSVPIMFHCLLTCFVIFVVCVAIDLFREQIFRIIKIEKVINAISDRLPKGLVE